MTVSSLTNKVPFAGDNVSTVFPFTFKIFLTTDLSIRKVLIATGAETVVTDAVIAINGEAGGTVTLSSPLLSTYSLIIERIVPLTQTADYEEGDPFPAATHEKALDKIVMMIQQLNTLLAQQTLILPATSVSPITMPTPVAGKVLTGVSATAVSWETLAYTVLSYNGSFLRGLDAAKSATPAVGDVYLATDVGKLYVCLAVNVWTWYADFTINTLTAKSTPVLADVLAIEDSAASWARKKITLTALKTLVNPPSTALNYRTVSALMEMSRGVATTDGMACIMASGDLRVWGNDLKVGGGLGAVNFQVPVQATLPSTAVLPIVKVYGHHSNMYCIDSLGQVFATGLNAEGELGNGGVAAATQIWSKVLLLTDVIKLVIPKGTSLAADTCVFALKSDGTVWVWGQNTAGYLGVTIGNKSTPVQTSLSNIVDIAANGILCHAAACDSNGDVWAVGLNAAGQLGINSVVASTSWVKLTDAGIAAKNVVKVYCSGEAGTGTTHYLCDDGTLWASGDNSNGQICDGTIVDTLVPKQIASLSTNVASLCASWDEYGSFCAVLKDGTIRTWGYNGYGQLGDGTVTLRSTIYNPALAGISKVVFGGTGTFGSFYALTTGGNLYAAGHSVYGNNADGTILTAPNTWKSCVGYPAGRLTDVSACGAGAYYRPMVLDSNGVMYVSGDNTNGQLGIGSLLTPSAVFVPVHF
jgi:alpha-tubulin suppressor-like RCC1 family protein